MNHGSHEIEIIQNRYKNTGKPHYKFENKKLFNKKTIIAYSSFFVLLIALVAFGSNSIQNNEELSNVASAATTTADESKVASVDKAVEANVVAGLAETANLPVAANTANLASSLAVSQAYTQDSNLIVEKPKILDAKIGDRQIVKHVVEDGENIDSIVTIYGITSQTIRWANSLKDNTIDTGEELRIPPVDGIIYVIKDGDTVDSISNKYQAEKDRIISFNDLEIGGLTSGKEIIIPGGVLPETDRPEYVAPVVKQQTAVSVTSSYGDYGGSILNRYYNNLPQTSGNDYASGNCTWYVFERRKQMGRPIGSSWGDAASWNYSAQIRGFAVNKTPAVGAIMQNGGGYGHVAVVESLNADGSLTISDMNYGWANNMITIRTIPAGSISSYNYIH